MININEILDDIYDSTCSAVTDGYDIAKILLSQDIYDAIKKENEEIAGVGKGDFDRLLVYPIEISDDVESYVVVVNIVGRFEKGRDNYK